MAKWFVFDEDENEFQVFATEEEAQNCFNFWLEEYSANAAADGEWAEGVKNLRMGRFTKGVDLVETEEGAQRTVLVYM